jgi:hypothetical protein
MVKKILSRQTDDVEEEVKSKQNKNKKITKHNDQTAVERKRKELSSDKDAGEEAEVFEPKKKKQKRQNETYFAKGVLPDFENRIPHHIKNASYIAAVNALNAEQEDNTKFLLLFDYPGIGKTMTVRAAAEDAKFFHILIPIHSCTAMYRFIKTVHKWLESDNTYKDGPISEYDTIEHIEECSSAAILSILEIALERLKEGEQCSFITINEHSYDGAVKQEEQFRVRRIRELIKTIISFSGMQGLLLHFDECQYFSQSRDFKCPLNDRATKKYTKQHSSYLSNFTLIGFSMFLASLTTIARIAMSGTNLSGEKCMPVDSGIKAFTNTSPIYSTIDDIENIMNVYYNVTHIDTKELQKIYMKLVGPFRNLQYFLKHLTIYGKSSINDIDFKTLDAAYDSAYSSFDKNTHIITNCNIINEMMLCAKYPALFCGKDGYLNVAGELIIYDSKDDLKSQKETQDSQDNDQQEHEQHQGVIAFDVRSISPSWLDLQTQGLARWLFRSGKYCLLLPFPMLERFWNEKSTMFFKLKNVNELRTCIKAMPLSQGTNDHVLQLMVALELTVSAFLERYFLLIYRYQTHHFSSGYVGKRQFLLHIVMKVRLLV